MLKFGLTGGTGTGKSTVAEVLKKQGVPIVDADSLARQAVQAGSACLHSIAHEFGPAYLDLAGCLDRKRMGALVFSDDGARHRLNEIVHPEVKRLAAARFAELEEGGYVLSGYDVPLLFDEGLTGYFPVVVVWASDEARIRRLMLRDRLTRTEVEKRMASQMPMEEKLRRADFVVRNDGSEEDLKTQINDLVFWLRTIIS